MRRMTVVALFLFSGSAVQLMSPLVVRRFIDAAAAGGAHAPLSLLWGLAGLFIALTILAQLLAIGATFHSEHLGWAATNAMRRDLAAHALALDMSFHTARSPGELIERVDGDVAALANFFSNFILQVLGGGLLLAGILVVVLAQDLRVGAALTLFAALAAVALHAARNLAGDQWERFRQAWSEMAAFLEERIAGLEDIRANGGGRHVMAQLAVLNREADMSFVTAARRGNWIYMIASALFSIGFGVALALGASFFLAGDITIGTVFMFMQFAGMMAMPLILIGQQLQQFQTAVASLRRIEELLAIRPTILGGHGVGWRDARNRAPEVVLDGLKFSYHPDAPVIRGIDLKVGPGKILGLLGRTGSGKTTLARLLFRLYDPDGGRILLDGRDVRDATLEELRLRIGLVTQDVQLFDASIRDNATLFDDSIPDPQVESVLRDLGLGEWLSRQPQGLHTVLTGGGGLSAGEAQLLAFARVFLKDPGLVVLDEASSRLDPATDALIEQALDKLLHSRTGGAPRTTIIIAHKLSTVRRADDIAILDKGRLLEFGERTALEADEGSAFSGLLRSGIEAALA